MVKATMLLPGRTILERDGKGRIVAQVPIQTVVRHPEGCSRHVHVNKNLCYDEGAIVEMS